MFLRCKAVPGWLRPTRQGRSRELQGRPPSLRTQRASLWAPDLEARGPVTLGPEGLRPLPLDHPLQGRGLTPAPVFWGLPMVIQAPRPAVTCPPRHHWPTLSPRSWACWTHSDECGPPSPALRPHGDLRSALPAAAAPGGAEKGVWSPYSPWALVGFDPRETGFTYRTIQNSLTHSELA